MIIIVTIYVFFISISIWRGTSQAFTPQLKRFPQDEGMNYYYYYYYYYCYYRWSISSPKRLDRLWSP